MPDLKRVTSGEFLRPEHTEEPGNQPRLMFWAKVHEVAPEVQASLYDEVLPHFLRYRRSGGRSWDFDAFLGRWLGISAVSGLSQNYPPKNGNWMS